jgi:diguanylate cyclase (GGDEF)-like protein/PAS domain S-box-containing protein
MSVHILVVEHNPERRRSVTAALAAAGHQVEVVDSADAALAALARPTPPALVLIEEHLPDMAALDFLQAADGLARSAPVVVMGQDEAAGRWVEAARLGAVDFVLRDRQGGYLQTLAARLQAAVEREGQRDEAARMADALASTAAAVVIADQAGAVQLVNEACARLLGREVEAIARGTLSDLFPLEDEPRVKADLFGAVHAGGEWAGEVAVQTQGGEKVPCIVTLSPIRRAGGRVDGLVLTLRDVADRVAMEDALRAANRRLAEQASRDPLTGLYNRGYLHEVLEREMARALRYGDVLSLVMVDLDEFKDVNDEFGHAAGDDVLRDVARMLRPGLRDGDVLARYGGDEFCVLLPNTDAKAALVVADRLRVQVASAPLSVKTPKRVMLSAGLATSEDVPAEEGNPMDVLLRLADRALYASKDAGGDRVTVWTTDLEAA